MDSFQRGDLDLERLISGSQLVERLDLDVERLVGGASTAVRGDGYAMGFAAGAGNLDRPRVGRRVGVDLETAQGASRFAAEGDHPAVVAALGRLPRMSMWRHAPIFSVLATSRAVARVPATLGT